MKKKGVVVVGGGTGTFNVLRGLKNYVEKLDISAVVTMADDGGSNRVLRDEFGLLPTSGIRQAIVALSEDEGLMRELFIYRYWQGTGIKGMTFGNLFMAALADILGSQKEAIEETCELLEVQGEILPVSYDDVRLLAEYEDGTEVLGEHTIDEAEERVGKKKIVGLRTVPTTKIDEKAKKRLVDAELIVLGPGDLYTNTIANMVVKGVPEAIKQSKGEIVFVMNLMTKLGETFNYKASNFLEDLAKYIPLSEIDYVVLNDKQDYANELLSLYKKEEAKPVEDDLGEEYKGISVIRADVVSRKKTEKQKGDKIERSMIRHDSERLAKVLLEVIGE